MCTLQEAKEANPTARSVSWSSSVPAAFPVYLEYAALLSHLGHDELSREYAQRAVDVGNVTLGEAGQLVQQLVRDKYVQTNAPR